MKVPATALLTVSIVTFSIFGSTVNSITAVASAASLTATVYFIVDAAWLSRRKDILLEKMKDTGELLEVEVETLREENDELLKIRDSLRETVKGLDKTLLTAGEETDRLAKINAHLKSEVDKISKLYEKTRKFASLFIKTSEIYKDLTSDLGKTARNIEHGIGDNVDKLETLVDTLTKRTEEEFKKLDVNGDGCVTLEEFLGN